MRLALVVGIVTVVLLPVVLIGAAGGAVTVVEGSSVAWVGQAETLADIPSPFQALYREAATAFAVPTGILAAIGKVECNHGRGDCYHPNQAGSEGPMQFLPATFAAYSWASGATDPSPYDPRDAIFAAAAKLAHDGIDQNPAGAIYSYNHAIWYVALVTAWATAYGYLPSGSLAALAVLNHPNLDLRAEAAADARSGNVDARVLAVLLVLATTHRLQAVGPFISGHSYNVAGTTHPSNHAFGRAADLPIVDGSPVSSSNASARTIGEAISHLPPPLRPDELGWVWLLCRDCLTWEVGDLVGWGDDSLARVQGWDAAMGFVLGHCRRRDKAARVRVGRTAGQERPDSAPRITTAAMPVSAILCLTGSF